MSIVRGRYMIPKVSLSWVKKKDSHNSMDLREMQGKVRFIESFTEENTND